MCSLEPRPDAAAEDADESLLSLGPGAGIAGYTAQCLQVTSVRDAANDPRLDVEEQRRLRVRLGHVLAAPVTDPSGTLCGVVEVS